MADEQDTEWHHEGLVMLKVQIVIARVLIIIAKMLIISTNLSMGERDTCSELLTRYAKKLDWEENGDAP